VSGTHRPELRLRVDPQVFLLLEQRAADAGIPSVPGRSGGAAEYVRRLIHDHLGLPLPGDPHRIQSAAYAAKGGEAMLTVEFEDLKGNRHVEKYEALEEAMARFVQYDGDGKTSERIRLLRGPEILRYKYVGPDAKVFED
jgi:hypothetical protein